MVEEAKRQGLPTDAPDSLFRSWAHMRPWPDAAALARLRLPFGFVTNCSASLALIAASQSGLQPHFVLSAKEIGWFKPHPAAYRAGCERLGVAPAETRPDQAGVATSIPALRSLEGITKAVGRARKSARGGSLPTTQSSVR